MTRSAGISYYASGFPKGSNIGKAIDKMQGNDRKVVGESKDRIDFSKSKDGSFYNDAWQDKDYINVPITQGNSDWEGWSSNLKPASEFIIMARKPIEASTIAKNCLKHGVGAINIDASRISYNGEGPNTNGRYPSNVIFDEEMAKELDKQSGISKSNGHWAKCKVTGYGKFGGGKTEYFGVGKKDKSLGGASRYFYVAKASKTEKNAGCDKNNHPCVKPISLLEYLITMVTPAGGTVLDFFMGSGSCGIAAQNLGFDYIGIEKEKHYFNISVKRIAWWKEEMEKEADLLYDIFSERNNG